MPDRIPDQSFIHRFILMSVNVSGGRDRNPVNLPMTLLQFMRESPRCLRYYLESANDCVHGSLGWHKSLKIEARCKGTDHIDVVDDVRQPLSRILRRHQPRRAE